MNLWNSESVYSNLSRCQVCSKKASGKRFGAIVCRACAAFFRRSDLFKRTMSCKRNGKCEFFKNGFFVCKYCRLQKCIAVGMNLENMHLNSDCSTVDEETTRLESAIPPTIDIFCGRSNLIIFRMPKNSSQGYSKNVIDVQLLIDKISNMIQQGPATPVCANNRLSKLAIALHPVLKSRHSVNPPDSLKYGREESLAQLEHNVVLVANWLTYFDDFQMLPPNLQLQMVQGIWSIWWRLKQLAYSSSEIKKNFDKETIRKMKTGTLIRRYDQNRIDMSWLSNYSVEELKFFIDLSNEVRLDEMTRAMIELEPTEVELSFMFCQLCFHTVGKRFQGEILQISEKFQETLANDLHEYYVKDQKNPYYMKRLASMMKINNQIQRLTVLSAYSSILVDRFESQKLKTLILSEKYYVAVAGNLYYHKWVDLHFVTNNIELKHLFLSFCVSLGLVIFYDRITKQTSRIHFYVALMIDCEMYVEMSSCESACSSPISCQVCGQECNGKFHYGAMVCRACAAFFRSVLSLKSRIKLCFIGLISRRSVEFKTSKSCHRIKKCDFLKKGYFTCKYCRLQKCLKVGMSYERFQFDRDVNKVNKIVVLGGRIPPSIDTFCGRSNLIIFRGPQTSASSSSCPSPDSPKNFINCQFLIDKAIKILQQGPESPIFTRNRLEKLAVVLNPVLEFQPAIEPPDMGNFGKEESLAQLEHVVILVTKWLTHFDEFQMLPAKLQIQMLQGIWSVWWRLGRLAYTSMKIRRSFDIDTIKRMETNTLVHSYDQERLDMSWLSKYTVDELKFFMDIKNEVRLDNQTRAMIDLDPSDIELSFMLGQLCFQYVGKRFQGEILQVADRFQEMLANDLHDYYVNELRVPQYVTRLASMMKINNQIQMDIYNNIKKTELANIFDIFCVEVSHPEMFVDF
ncbi:hypothetical protein CRE_09120 [Caenorhabditis remanei]|uniref:Nuclear Hormone Receptor family n=1 Tax=Caenorhabditis remanei TaxID=31234 RepID=E3LJE9_CAERE|nr:hypothetical protein CRE_09120 [Caenorhabditis remanei]